jgi:hypothetical protein
VTIALSDKLEIHSNRNPWRGIESQIACLLSTLRVDISEKINRLGNRLEPTLSPAIHKCGWLSTQTHIVSGRCDPKVNIMCTVWMCYYVRMTGLLLWTCAHNTSEAVLHDVTLVSFHSSVQWASDRHIFSNWKSRSKWLSHHRFTTVTWRNKLGIPNCIDVSVGIYVVFIRSLRLIFFSVI